MAMDRPIMFKQDRINKMKIDEDSMCVPHIRFSDLYGGLAVICMGGHMYGRYT